MKIVDLDPWFEKVIDETHFQQVATLAEADGICFLCPKCFETNGGEVGTHRVLCWRPHVPQTIPPVPGRWELLGTGFADLTLRAGSSSVLLTSGCMAHFLVQAGEIQMC